MRKSQKQSETFSDKKEEEKIKAILIVLLFKEISQLFSESRGGYHECDIVAEEEEKEEEEDKTSPFQNRMIMSLKEKNLMHEGEGRQFSFLI